MQKIALVLAIAAVGEGLIALHLVRQLQAERENAQTLQARVVELERRVPQRAAGATFVAIPAPTSSPFAVVGQSAPAQPTPVMNGQTIIALPDQQQTREQMAASMERQRTLLKDPEYREALQTQQKMMLMRTSPQVARDLNLTADQVDRLFGTLAKQSLRGMEAMNLWEEQPEPAQQQKVMEQYTAAAGSALTARAGFITEPGSERSADSIRFAEQSLQSLTQNQEKQREALARVLTPEQLKVIEDENNADLQMHRLQLRMMQAQEAAGLPSQEDLEQRMILRGDVSATSSSN